ncbi:phytanoyl-CoA dioxygenase family protein [Tahibacter amnicola]|uniref:Phytanoyl-CoA dioxygenase family protein n=1 Tax=Tahibacter amnicola TaxID=2976241 RepID=A0ABY6BH68_9GAMM|nr:phytanoyl-CoA dioxygenase family protein [Tahibacter amnicola]UXI69209.1 phytanoyl-CoA dioxygenase family protein [Tahibacter amnicola]
MDTFSPVSMEPPVDLRKMRVFRAEAFPASPNTPWLDRPDYEAQIQARLANGTLTAEQAEWCRKWARDGYLIIPGMFSTDELDGAWSEYEARIAAGELVPLEDHAISVQNPLPGRVLNPHFKVPGFNAILRNRRAEEIVSVLLGAKALPFQTIAGHKGSEQLAHSDSIHMTTYPQGYLVANWIAMQDIAPDSGPLVYYPGSHRLPYAYSRECGITLEEGRKGYEAYHAKYEPHVEATIRDNALDAHYFHAKKGDVLFWHANLLHGGSRIKDPLSSRRALVCHYFAEGCLCYHDYTGSPSHLVRLPMLDAEDFDAASYLSFNPDVAAAGVDAYQHYVNHGYNEGRRVR